jgi:hypothetical protein
MHLQSDDVVFGTWDPTTKTFGTGSPKTAVKINGIRESSATNDGYVQLTFGRIFGFTESTITQDTVGSFVNRNFMIEMDITPSYICNIDNAVMADLAMLDDLHTRNIGGDRISLDVFTGSAVEFTPFLNIRANYQYIHDTWAGGGTYSSFLGGGKTAGITVCNKLDDLTKANGGTFQCPDDGPKLTAPAPYPNNPNIMACSLTMMTGYAARVYAGTDIGAAIKAGVAKLAANTQTYEPRALIVVTDGEPMMCTAPQGGDLCWKGAQPCCTDGWCDIGNADADPYIPRGAACHAAHDQLDAGKTAAGVDAKNAHVDLFIIKLRGSATDNSAQYAQQLVQLAGGRGTFTWLTDATQLADTFKTIVGQVPITLVK